MEACALARTSSLLLRVRGGDDRAREALFARYLPIVRQAVALRAGKRLRDLGEDEDLVQESLLAALRELAQFEPRSEGSFRSWMVRIVEGRVRDHWRRSVAQKRGGGQVRQLGDDLDQLTAGAVGVAPDPSPSALAGAAEQGERVERALLELSARERDVIAMRALQRMSYDEIAVELSLGGSSSARAVFARAAARLAARLKQRGDPRAR